MDTNEELAILEVVESAEAVDSLELEEAVTEEVGFTEPEPETLSEALAGKTIKSISMNLGGGMLTTVFGAVTDFAPDEYGMIEVFAPYLVQASDDGLVFTPLVNFADGWTNQVSRHVIVASGDLQADQLSLYLDLIANISSQGTESTRDTQRRTIH